MWTWYLLIIGELCGLVLAHGNLHEKAEILAEYCIYCVVKLKISA